MSEEDDALLHDLIGSDAGDSSHMGAVGLSERDEDGDDADEPRMATPKMPDELDDKAAAKKNKVLIIVFISMVIVATLNKLFGILVYIPFQNYPLYINLFTTAFYIPASFAYIIPMIKYGKAITPAQEAVPKRVFAVMGLLDSIAGSMQGLAIAALQNGALVTLLLQGAIPISMLISALLLKVKYRRFQYAGALLVMAGLGIVVAPKVIQPDSGGHDVGLWSAVLILSCVPMCLSSVYKEKALGDTELDPVYMNGWIAVYQALAALPLLFPAAPAANVQINAIGTNLWDGVRCTGQINSITGGSQPDDCEMGPYYLAIYLFFNVAYNVLILVLIAISSAAMLWLAITITVPVVNLSFSLKFMPNHKPLTWEDVVGLIVIMAGLIIYRFYSKIQRAIKLKLNPPEPGKPLVVPSTPGGTPIPESPATPAGTNTPMLGGLGGHDHHTKRKGRKAERARRNERDTSVQQHSSRYQALDEDAL